MSLKRESDFLTHRKIIFVNRFFYPDHSATSQMLSDLAFDLAKAGKSVEIVTSRLRYDDPSAHLPVYEKIDGVTVFRVWTSQFGRDNLVGRAIDYLTFYLTAGWRLWRRTDSKSVVIAKTDPPLISVVAAPVAKLRRAGYINWLQDLFPEVAAALGVKFIHGPVLALLKWARNLTLRAAYMNVVLGRRMEVLVHSQKVPMAKISTITNWADGVAIKPVPKEDNSLRRAWGLEGKFVVGYSGNLGRAHEFQTILQAATILKGRQDIVFLFIGDGAQSHNVKRESSRLGLDNVQFKPYQPREHLSESLSVPDVHLVSLIPKLEGLVVPSKFYGVTAVGRPTIFIGDLQGEIARLLLESDCGDTVSTGNGEELASRILEFVDKCLKREHQGQRARALFELKYDRKNALKIWGRLIDQI